MAISTSDIEDQAKAPQRSSTDEGSVTERSIKELIEADRYTKATGVSAVPFGLRIARIRFPGTP